MKQAKAAGKEPELESGYRDAIVSSGVDQFLQRELQNLNHPLATRKHRGDWYAACGLRTPPLSTADELEAIGNSRVSPLAHNEDISLDDPRTAAMAPIHGHRLADH